MIKRLVIKKLMPFIMVGCTTAPEVKPCLCETVATQPSCVDSSATAHEVPETAAATETNSASVERSHGQDTNDSEIVEMNAPIQVSQTDELAAPVKELPEQSPIEEIDLKNNGNVGRKLIVTSSELNVRSGPSMESPVVGLLKQGSEVQMLSREGVWVMINDQQYVSIRHLKEN